MGGEGVRQRGGREATRGRRGETRFERGHRRSRRASPEGSLGRADGGTRGRAPGRSSANAPAQIAHEVRGAEVHQAPRRGGVLLGEAAQHREHVRLLRPFVLVVEPLEERAQEREMAPDVRGREQAVVELERERGERALADVQDGVPQLLRQRPDRRVRGGRVVRHRARACIRLRARRLREKQLCARRNARSDARGPRARAARAAAEVSPGGRDARCAVHASRSLAARASGGDAARCAWRARGRRMGNF